MKRRTVKILAVVVVSYVVFPFGAGLFAIGDRDGPKIYPRAYHANLYIISYEIVGMKSRGQTLSLSVRGFTDYLGIEFRLSNRNNIIFVCNLSSERHSSLWPVGNCHSSNRHAKRYTYANSGLFDLGFAPTG